MQKLAFINNSLFFKQLKPYAVLLLILLIAYLPVSTFYFGMKNDAFSDNFPNKFFLSEAIHSGNMPLWNPYMNFGFPIYADVGFAFFNPITWMFALIGYNAYTLTAEVLVYIYIGGVFMYWLGKHFKFSNTVSLAIAAMYMCSGFFAGCLTFINYITAAAFLPMAVLALLKLTAKPCYKTSFLFAIACYFVFAGGHPFIPGAFIYFVFIFVVLLFFYTGGQLSNYKKLLTYLSIAIGVFVLLYLPALYSYINILPLYGRNYPAPQSLNIAQGFTASSYLSFLLPFSTITTTDIFNADVTMRNGYFSIAGFVCVLLCFKNASTQPRLFLSVGLIMLLISIGGPLKAFIFNKLPLFSYITHNGEFRMFSILCFCVTAGFGLQQLKTGNKAFIRLFTIVLWMITGACVIIIITLIVTKQANIGGIFSLFKQPLPCTQKIKDFLAGPFPWFLFTSAALTLLVCVLSLVAIKKSRFNWLFIIILFDIVVNSIIYLPVTGVGQVTLKSIQAVYNTSPIGIPVPPLIAVNKIDTLDAKTTGLVGDITYYNKLIGTTKLTDYPSYFASTGGYFNNQLVVDEVSRHPYLFVKKGDTANTRITVQRFKSAFIEMDVNSPQDDTLVFLQNNYRFWHAVVNGQKAPITTTSITFMSVKIAKGTNHIIFYYEDRWLGFCLLISLAVFIVSLSVIARQRFIGKSAMQNQ